MSVQHSCHPGEQLSDDFELFVRNYLSMGSDGVCGCVMFDEMMDRRDEIHRAYNASKPTAQGKEMSQASKEEQDMELNVLVLGGKLSDRNMLTTLIADTLHQQGFGAVARTTIGETVPTMSMLDLIQQEHPHLFAEPIHVTAITDAHGLIAPDHDNDPHYNTLIVLHPTTQPPSIDPERYQDSDSFDHNMRMAVVLDSDDNDQAPLLVVDEELEEVED